MSPRILLYFLMSFFCCAVASSLLGCGEDNNSNPTSITTESQSPTPTQDTAADIIKQQQAQLGMVYAQRAQQYEENGQDFYAALMMAKAIDFQGYGKPDAQPIYQDLAAAQRFMTKLEPHRPLWEVKYDRHQYSETLSIDISFTGKYAVTGHRDGEVLIWDLSTGQIIRRWTTQDRKITSVMISEDDSTISGMDESKLHLWSLPDNKALRSLDISPAERHSVFLSQDGTRLLTGGNQGRIQLWDTSTGQALYSNQSSKLAIRSMAMTRDGKQLAWGDDAGVIRVANPDNDNPPRELKQHEGAVLSLCFDLKDKQLVSGGSDHKLIFWDYKTGQVHFTQDDHQTGVEAIRFNHKFGNLITVESSGMYMQRSSADGRTFRKFLSPFKVKSLGFNQEGLFLVAAVNHRNGRPIIYHLTGRVLDTLKFASDEISAVAFSPNGKKLALARMDQKILVYEAWTGTLLHELETDIRNIKALAFNEQANMLSTGSDQWLEVWNLETGEVAAPIRMQAETAIEFFKTKPALVAAGSVGTRIVSLFKNQAGERQISDGIRATDIQIVNDEEVYYTAQERVYRWTLGNNRFSRILTFNGNTRNQKLSDDASMILATENNQNIFTRPLAETRGRLIGKLPAMITDLEFSGNAAYGLSLTHDQQVHLWDTGKTIQKLQLEKREAKITAMAITKDAQLAAVVDQDGRLRVWRLLSSDQRKQLDLNQGISRSMAFSPDGRKLGMIYKNNLIREYDTQSGALIRTSKEQKISLSNMKLRYSSDSNTLLLSRETGGIFRFNPEKDQELQSIVTRAGKLRDIGYSPNDNWAAIAAVDQQPYTVDLKTGAITRYHKADAHIRHIVCLPDSQGFITTHADGKILIWKLGEQFPIDSLQHDRVRRLAVSPDGKLLVSSDDSGKLLYWDLSTGQLLHEIKAHDSTILQLKFSQDGKQLFTSDKGQWMKVWNPQGKLIRSIHLGLLWRQLAIGPNGQHLAISQHNVKDTDLVTLQDQPPANLYQYIKSGAYRIEGMNILPGDSGLISASGFKLHVFE